MKSLFVALLGVAVLAAPLTDTFAQPGGSPAGSDTRPANPAGNAADTSAPTRPDAKADAAPGTTRPESGSTGPAVATPPAGSAGGSVSGTIKSEERRDDGASALPRSSVSERTTIFGLSPTAAVLIAAALLLVVVLAIVAMTRSNGDYIDNRRM
jgi:hypothetical protein